MTTLIVTNQTVWVAVSRYGPEDDVEPIVALGETKEAAEAALDKIIRDMAKDTDTTEDELRELWVDEHTVELPIHIC